MEQHLPQIFFSGDSAAVPAPSTSHVFHVESQITKQLMAHVRFTSEDGRVRFNFLHRRLQWQRRPAGRGGAGAGAPPIFEKKKDKKGKIKKNWKRRNGGESGGGGGVYRNEEIIDGVP